MDTMRDGGAVGTDTGTDSALLAGWVTDPTDETLGPRLDARLDELEVEVYRTLLIRDEVDRIAAAAEAAGLTGQRLRAQVLASDLLSRSGGADQALGTQHELLGECQREGLLLLARHLHTYLASTCDRLGMRDRTMKHALAGLSKDVEPEDGDWDTLLPTTDVVPAGMAEERARAWRAEALMVSVLMAMSRPNADATLMERALAVVRCDCLPTLVATTAANFAEAAVEIGRPDIAMQMADEALATMREHPDAEAVITWESVARGRLGGGDVVAARAAIGRALELEPLLGVSDTNGDPWQTAAQLALADDRPEEGLQVLESPRRPSVRSPYTEWRDLRTRAELHAALAQWQPAYEALQRHLVVYEQIRSVESDRVVVDVETLVTVNEERQRAREFEQLSLTDPLTGLANRRAVEAWLDRLAELGSASIALAIVDIDHFKAVNDTFSHQVGDEVLQRLGACLETAGKVLDRETMVGRLGGEEFILAWPTTSEEDARLMADYVRNRAAALVLDDLAPELSVTVSIGVTHVKTCDDLRGNPRAALRRADDALYRAKAAGRNAVRVG